MLHPYEHISKSLVLDIIDGPDKQGRVHVKVVGNKAFTRRQDTSFYTSRDNYGLSLRYKKNELVSFEFTINKEWL